MLPTRWASRSRSRFAWFVLSAVLSWHIADVGTQSTSNGQFNPGLTVHAIVFNRFPVLKGLRYAVCLSRVAHLLTMYP